MRSSPGLETEEEGILRGKCPADYPSIEILSLVSVIPFFTGSLSTGVATFPQLCLVEFLLDQTFFLVIPGLWPSSSLNSTSS